MILALMERKAGGQQDVMVILRHDEAQALVDGSRGPMAIRLGRIREVVERNGERLEDVDAICLVSADAALRDEESITAAMVEILGTENVNIVDERPHAPSRN